LDSHLVVRPGDPRGLKIAERLGLPHHVYSSTAPIWHLTRPPNR